LRPGLYAITLDGYERSFDYWRSQSAARQLAVDRNTLRQSLSGRDLIYFSGITTAVMPNEHLEILFDELSAARQRGTKVAFDPNYRSRLWSNQAFAIQVTGEALSLSDIVLPTIDDERSLYGDENPSATLDRISAFGPAEVVVKSGSDPAFYRLDGDGGTSSAQIVHTPIDTTGAGDVFNGGYLANRLLGRPISTSLQEAHSVAAISIQSKGALTPHLKLVDLELRINYTAKSNQSGHLGHLSRVPLVKILSRRGI
jgi:2-dehydro-3-deoxygluconokinase